MDMVDILRALIDNLHILGSKPDGFPCCPICGCYVSLHRSTWGKEHAKDCAWRLAEEYIRKEEDTLERDEF